MKKIITLSLLLLLIKTGFAQSWVKKADLTDSILTQYGSSYGISGGTAFSIGDTGYIVSGANGFTFFSYTFIYDEVTNTWDTVAKFPYTEGGYAGGGVKAGFALNGNGYVGTGSFFGQPLTKEFYEYDPHTNTWIKKAFMSVQRGYGVGFAINGRGFIGLGLGGVGVGTTGPPLHDFWEYNPNTGDSGAWTQIVPYPGEGNQLCFAFTVGDKAYVGGGINQNTNQACDDFWEYDTINMMWTRVATFPGGPRSQGASSSTCNKGYIGLGQNSSGNFVNDFWEFDPNKGDSGTWTQIATIPIPPGRSTPEAFTIGRSIYAGNGSNSSGAVPDLWEYTPSVTPAFSADTTVCAGGSISFTDTSNYSPDHWYWQFPGGKPDTSSSQNPTVEYDTAGIFNVTLTAWNSCDSGTQTFTNYIKANPYSGTLSITPMSPSVCIGQTITLKAIGSSGAKYQWIGTSDTTDSINVSPQKDTTYELVVGSGNCSKDTLISVIANTPPPLVINPPSPVEVCAGQGVTLIADTTGRNYIWTPDAGLSDTTGSTVLANPTADVTYTVAGLDSLGCSVSATEELIVNAGPNKPIITVSVTGDTLISSAKNGNQWYVNGQPVKGANDSIYIIAGLPKDTFKVAVTNVANGCSTTSDSVVVSAGINQLLINSNQLTIYPNPTNGTINVTINSSVGELKDWNLQLIDVLGQTLYTKSVLSYNNEIDLSNLAGGIYFIVVINRSDRVVFPIIKQSY